jgi:hypothetical protein
MRKCFLTNNPYSFEDAINNAQDGVYCLLPFLAISPHENYITRKRRDPLSSDDIRKKHESRTALNKNRVSFLAKFCGSLFSGMKIDLLSIDIQCNNKLLKECFGEFELDIEEIEHKVITELKEPHLLVGTSDLCEEEMYLTEFSRKVETKEVQQKIDSLVHGEGGIRKRGINKSTFKQFYNLFNLLVQEAIKNKIKTIVLANAELEAIYKYSSENIKKKYPEIYIVTPHHYFHNFHTERTVAIQSDKKFNPKEYFKTSMKYTKPLLISVKKKEEAIKILKAINILVNTAKAGSDYSGSIFINVPIVFCINTKSETGKIERYFTFTDSIEAHVNHEIDILIKKERYKDYDEDNNQAGLTCTDPSLWEKGGTLN